MRRSGIFLFAVLASASSFSASAQENEPTASVMQSFGILGTWAFRGCGASAAWTNKFYVSDGKVMQTLTWGSTYSGELTNGGLISVITDAKILGNTVIIRKQENNIGDVDDRSENLKYYGVPYAEIDEVYLKRAERIRLWSRSRVATQQGGMLFVDKGVDERRGIAEPWYERCR